MAGELTPEQAASKITQLESALDKVAARVDKLERAQKEFERSSRAAAARLGRF